MATQRAIVFPVALVGLFIASCSSFLAQNVPGFVAPKIGNAFATVQSRPASVMRAHKDGGLSQENMPERRDFLKGVAASTLIGASILSTKASAEETFNIDFEVQLSEGKTGKFVVEVHPEWAPLGAERFEELAAKGILDECRFFRVISGFIAQFGINGDPKVSAKWRNANIKDDPVKVSNSRGTIVFATAGPNTRTSQLFINFADNTFLDRSGFAPFGKIVQGMDVVDALYAGYGEGAPRGKGPDQGRIQTEGNKYLSKSFPQLSYIIKATVQR
mmetsp:Transcript_17669/g.25800  ORF Transcript_17669/g.25800 Transcript_17669/m.25800 type:complete len:274 (-) Transcript_17669:112-933(-)|eukprot:CAMPEP_0113944092 /NCGR_PEP_ID=MMETSP1339-20121228/30633_1 /TAXON_ID=94617 /ORGANISM="Fibrocapsa japonica" /LENGTH=273 /DNA_ID=CAMNT_0000949163 /DNA_START=32 /DNA_END=853 /DNA_ORIENTATION=+ /assembly_acc=CAM_ASM_000762